jgi:hypothetical protein
MRRLHHLVAAVVAFTAACSSGSSTAPPAPVDHDAQGSWGENSDGHLNPGSLFLIALSESSGVIVGTGSYAGEAGPYGALAVTGSVAHDSVRLAIVSVPEPTVFPQLKPDTVHFVGVLTTRDRIDGTLTRGNVANPFGLVRLTVGDRP